MKWFQHRSDSYSNFKLRKLIEERGLTGYGFFWVCCELVAQQGEGLKITSEKFWRGALASASGLRSDHVERLLLALAELSLISEEALKNEGALYIPKMKEYSDDYNRRVRRVSEHDSDNVPLDKNTLDKNTIHKNRESTPSQEARSFFSNKNDEQNKVIKYLVSQGVPESAAEKEMSKFVSYWTEKNKSGTQGRWEMQKTFEVKRRLGTWFRNIQEFKGRGKGKEIIGL